MAREARGGRDTTPAGGLEFERSSAPMGSRACRFRRRLNWQEEEEGSQRERLTPAVNTRGDSTGEAARRGADRNPIAYANAH